MPWAVTIDQTERHAVASDLINFDKKIAALFSGKPGSREQVSLNRTDRSLIIQANQVMQHIQSGVSIDDFHTLWEKFEKWTTGTVRIRPRDVYITVLTLMHGIRQAIVYKPSSVVAEPKYDMSPSLARNILIGSVSISTSCP